MQAHHLSEKPKAAITVTHLDENGFAGSFMPTDFFCRMASPAGHVTEGNSGPLFFAARELFPKYLELFALSFSFGPCCNLV